MKVLVVAAAVRDHGRPLLPLALALRDAGHEVRVVGSHHVGAAGLVGTDLPGVDLGRISARELVRRPGAALRDRRGEAGTDVVGAVLGNVNAAVLDAVVELALAWRPDLVVHDPLAVVGAVAAARTGVPAVLHGTGLHDGAALVAATLRSPALHAAVRRCIGELPPPELVLSVAPRSMVGQRPGLPLRWAAPPEQCRAPEWLRRPPDGPRIVVVRSGPGRADPTRAVLRAAPALDAEVVLVAPGPRTARRGLPGTVRRTGPVALDEVLPHATALVHDGCTPGVLAALAAGVPQLAVPGAGERRTNAELVAARGAGLALRGAGITAEALSHLVHDTGLRTTAQAVQREIAGMPAAREVVLELELLAGVR